MSDPFSRSSVKTGTTHNLLSTLVKHDYPTILSTKGRFADIAREIPSLSAGNFYVRLSLSASPFAKNNVEPGTPSESEMFETSQKLAENGIPVCIRIQPIFPGSEGAAARLIERSVKAKAVAVSLEYLKIPLEKRSAQFVALNDLYNGDLENFIRAFEMQISGRERSVSLDYKKSRMAALKAYANSLGISVGIAENELLHYSDLSGCCNGASSFLRHANDFRYTVASALKGKIAGLLRRADFEHEWLPSGNIGSWFNSTSRFGLKGPDANWSAYFDRAWTNQNAHFNPTFFDGVTNSDTLDDTGKPIYAFAPSSEFDTHPKNSGDMNSEVPRTPY